MILIGRKLLPRASLSLMLASSLSCHSTSTEPPPPACVSTAQPSISFTQVPPPGSSADVKGKVSFVALPCSADGFRVALFIHVPGFQPNFTCKPFENQPLTAIATDGTWDTRYDTDGIDIQATEFRAFLVAPSFTWPCFTDTLPTVNGSTVLATAVADR